MTRLIMIAGAPGEVACLHALGWHPPEAVGYADKSSTGHTFQIGPTEQGTAFVVR